VEGEVPAEALLGGLDEAQRAAVTSTAGPLCVHAGAGSGKTRVLTRRIAHRAATGDLEPRHTLALTFTRKAAGELRSRLQALGLREAVAAGTFHAVAYAQLRRHWDDRRATPPTLITSKATLVGELLGPKQALAGQVVAEIDWAAARLVRPADYLDKATQAGRRPPLPGDGVPDLMRRYEATKRQRGVVDFDDLLQLTLTLMTNDTKAADARRWLFRHLFVDEFQDVNPLQFRLIRAWLGDRADLFVVGDPHQAIYAWNGADARYLDRFGDAFPAERWPDRAVLHLRDNYRSTPQVLAAAAAVLDTARLVPHRPDGAPPVVAAHDDDTAEADALVRDLRDGHQAGLPWSGQAVLVRTGAQVAVIGSALGRAGIPHQRRGSGALLQRPTVKAVLRRLRQERYAMVVGDLTPEAPEVDEDQLPRYDPERDPEDLEALATLAQEYEALDAMPSADGFAAWLVAALRSDDAMTQDAVVVSTFHAAKGLEWPVVHLAGVEDGYVPSTYATTTEARDEERRLLYVAVTRAQDHLRLNWARTRTIGDKERARQPSPWLAAVEAAIAELERAAEPADGRRHLAGPRRVLHEQHPELDDRGPDDPVVERLEAWRAHAAKAARVPAEAILDDLTLRAIAEARPADADELSGIPGLGPVKAARFAEDLLAAVRPRVG
jgi:DNA helicase-2/ATP-dependent DNA helicase PcrA